MKTFIITWLVVQTLISKPKTKDDLYEFMASDSTGQVGVLYTDKLFQPGDTVYIIPGRKTSH